jgi:hypothetical protein
MDIRLSEYVLNIFDCLGTSKKCSISSCHIRCMVCHKVKNNKPLENQRFTRYRTSPNPSPAPDEQLSERQKFHFEASGGGCGCGGAVLGTKKSSPAKPRGAKLTSLSRQAAPKKKLAARLGGSGHLLRLSACALRDFYFPNLSLLIYPAGTPIKLSNSCPLPSLGGSS